MNNYAIYTDDYLAHFGVQGMKWGVRNYQNEDGSLTAKGKKRYASSMKKVEGLHKKSDKAQIKSAKAWRKQAKYAYKLNKEKAHTFRGYSKKIMKLDRKQAKYGLKAAKLNEKSVKYNQKASRIVERLNKKYGSVNINDLDQATIERGRRFGLNMV